MVSASTPVRQKCLLVAIATGGIFLLSACSSSSDGQSPDGGDSGDTASTPVINRDNHVDLVAFVFDILTGNAYFADIGQLPGWSDPTYGGVELPGGPEAVDTTVACLNGGTARFEWYAYGSVGFEEYLDFQFDNCQDDTVVFNGQLRRRNAAYRASNRDVSSDGISIDYPTRQIQFSGSVAEFDDGFRTERSTANARYRVQEGDTTLVLTDLNTSVSYGFVDGVGGSFTVRSPLTANRALSVDGSLQHAEIPSTSAASPYESGAIELVAEDGSELILNAANGDLDSVSVEIIAPDGTRETLTQPWSLWSDHLLYEFVFDDLFQWPSSGQ